MSKYEATHTVNLNDIDVDIELETPEIFEAASCLNDTEKKQLIKELQEELGEENGYYEINTLDDEYKHKVLVEAFNKYSLIELEQKFK